VEHEHHGCPGLHHVGPDDGRRPAPPVDLHGHLLDHERTLDTTHADHSLVQLLEQLT
jgi:hypothetical protein